MAGEPDWMMPPASMIFRHYPQKPPRWPLTDPSAAGIRCAPSTRFRYPARMTTTDAFMKSHHSPVAAPVQKEAGMAVSSARLVIDAHELEDLSERLGGESAVGLDTEFVRERTYYPKPGLVQISQGRSVQLLDAVQMNRMPALANLLKSAATTKIFHSVGEDLEVIRILTGVIPRPLFDTQIAAAMLGHPLQTRYEHLVGEVLGVELAGGKARSDWTRRPLSPDLLSYAAQDVIWLRRLYEALAEALERRQRLAWLQEDCERLVQAAEANESEPSVLRVKGAGRLDDRQLAILSVLADWRDSEARTRDLPRSFVIRDEGLIALAAAEPGSSLRGVLQALPAPVQRRYGSQLQRLVASAETEGFERPGSLNALTPEQRDWIKQAQKRVAGIAAELGIEPALLASRRDLTRLARGERPSWMAGWRGELLEDLAAL